MDKTATLCIFVQFKLVPGGRGMFLRLARENAAMSVAVEPGCTRFDVLECDQPDDVLLYELYADDEAFRRHLASEHFRAFDAASASLVREKTVRRLLAHEHAR